MDVYSVRASNNLRVFDVKTTFCSHNMKDFTRSSECALHLLTVCTMHYINIFHSFALLCSYGSILPLLALDATLIVYLHLSIVVDIISAFAFYTISMSLVEHYGTVIIV